MRDPQFQGASRGRHFFALDDARCLRCLPGNRSLLASKPGSTAVLVPDFFQPPELVGSPDIDLQHPPTTVPP